MILGDMLVDRCVTPDELRAAFARVLSLPLDGVELVTSMADAPPLKGATLEVTDLAGEFPLQICIYLATTADVAMAEVATKISEHFGARALIPSESADPYVMILLRPGSPAVEVNLDTHSLDELGAYRLAP